MATTLDSMATARDTDGPALEVTFGSTSNRRRPLLKPATLIGRSSCCDIRIESPEISPIHCLITRISNESAGGFVIRDCDSRCGVIVNGQPIRETQLFDGDVIQLGPFSFTVSLPSPSHTDSSSQANSPNPLEAALQEERDRILNLQKHIAGVEAERDHLAAQLHDLRMQTEPVFAEVRDSAELEALRTQVSELREQLDAVLRERDRLEAERADASTSVTENRVRLEKEIAAITAERNRFQAEVETLEFAVQQSHRDALAYLEQLDAATRDAERARRERDEHRARLDDLEQRLAKLEQDLETTRNERDRATSDLAQRSSPTDSAALRLELDEMRSMLSTLEAQRMNVMEERDHALAQLESFRNDGAAEDARIEALTAELAAAHERAALAEDRLQQAEQRLSDEREHAEFRLTAMRQELEKERVQLKQLVMQAAAQHTQTQAEIESLRGQLSGQKPGEIVARDAEPSELDDLRQRVRDLEAQLLGRPEGVPADLTQYEQELHQFRADLQQAQEEIARRESELEEQKNDVFERLKRTELDLSRERAAIARDRAELDRLRRDFQAEMEHAEREAETRARLAPIDQLASEVRGQAQEDPAPAAKLSKRIGDLLRRMK